MKKRPLSCNIVSSAIEILVESNYIMNRDIPVCTTAGCELDDRLSIRITYSQVFFISLYPDCLSGLPDFIYSG
jgi:hypothetical protein